MLTTATLPPKSASPHTRSLRMEWQLVALAFAAGLAHLPLLIRHALWLWQRPHYQFFPLVVAGSLVLAYSRMATPAIWVPGNALFAAGGLAGSWLLLAAADLIGSTWLGCVAGMFLLASLVYAAGGWKLCRQALPAWAFLWLIVPLPLDLDRLMMFKLQNLTTVWSSEFLDLLGVFHKRSGNAIELDGRQMLVEQACSGVNSLYSLLACTLFLILLTRRGWIRGVLLVASAVVWVLAANVTRVTGVILIETRWGIDVSTGWRHESFGLLLFAVAAGLLLSTDQFLAFLTSKGATEPEDRQLPSRESSYAERTRPLSSGTWVLAAIGVPAYLVLAVGFWAVDRTTQGVDLAAAPIAFPTKDCLPAKVGPWEEADFTVRHHEASSFFGEHSCIWQFSKARQKAAVSIDFPFPSWHDLTWCYLSQGWHIDSQNVGSDAQLPGGYLEVRMSQPMHRNGYLLFCEFDGRGRPLAARPGGMEASFFRHQTSLLRAKSWFGIEKEPAIDPPGPIYQLQALWDGYDKLSTEDEASLQNLFIQTGAALRQSSWVGR